MDKTDKPRGETWAPTNFFEWRQTPDRSRFILHQLWVADSGRTSWRQVPMKPAPPSDTTTPG